MANFHIVQEKQVQLDSQAFYFHRPQQNRARNDVLQTGTSNLISDQTCWQCCEVVERGEGSDRLPTTRKTQSAGLTKRRNGRKGHLGHCSCRNDHGEGGRAATFLAQCRNNWKILQCMENRIMNDKWQGKRCDTMRWGRRSKEQLIKQEAQKAIKSLFSRCRK